MDNKIILKLILLLIPNIICIKLIEMLTARPHQISGNGNLALLIILPYICFAFLFGLTWIKYLSDIPVSLRFQSVLSITSIVLIIVGIRNTYLSFQSFELQLTEAAMKHFTDTENARRFINAVSKGVTQYTNTLYFNYLTFFIYICFLNLIAFGKNWLMNSD
jgi:hypothetical protein